MKEAPYGLIGKRDSLVALRAKGGPECMIVP
jgi:hypothetical protein